MRVKSKIYAYNTKDDFAKKCLSLNLPLSLNDIPHTV